jgi:hypothetical protein
LYQEELVPEIKKFSLVKPTLQTDFHIDFNWWQQRDRDWRVHLYSYLCPQHQQSFADTSEDLLVDWVDPDTAEVQRVDGLQHVLITHCAKTEEFITEHTTLVEAAFRSFLSNGNMPMTSVELSAQLGRPPETILRTLSGGRVYKGLRPCPEC